MRLRRQPRPSRRRGRRGPGQRRRLPGGLPGRGHHPAREAGGRGRDEPRRLPADPRADPLQARDGGRLPRPGGGQQHRHPAAHRPLPALRPRDGGGVRPAAHRLRRPAHPRRDLPPPARGVRRRGRGRQRRLHRPAGAPGGEGRHRRRGNPLRLQRLRRAAPGAGELHPLHDLRRGRLRAALRHRHRRAPERRLLPLGAPRGAGGHGGQLPAAGARWSAAGRPTCASWR